MDLILIYSYLNKNGLEDVFVSFLFYFWGTLKYLLLLLPYLIVNVPFCIWHVKHLT